MVAVEVVATRNRRRRVHAKPGERAAHRKLVAFADAELARLIRIAESA